jgi:hypothetical protein
MPISRRERRNVAPVGANMGGPSRRERKIMNVVPVGAREIPGANVKSQ